MGSSTGNMLVDEETILEIFQNAPTITATHCEDTPMILANEERARMKMRFSSIFRTWKDPLTGGMPKIIVHGGELTSVKMQNCMFYT